MRTFKKGNWSENDCCPVCETQKDGEVTLVPIHGTEDGNNVQATLVHTQCIGERMIYYPEHNMITIECINL